MKSILFLLFSFTTSFTFSQATWRPGTVITKDGNTLEGYINDQEWDFAPVEVEFKTSDQIVKKFTVDEIISFSTNRPALYESHRVQFDGESQQPKALTHTKESENIKTERLFLEVKLNAAIGLLYMKERNDHRHFFIKQDTTVTELLNRSYISPVDKISILNVEMYKQQLTIITNDCQDVQRNLKSLKYTEDQLVTVFTKINECKNNQIQPTWAGVAAEKKHANFGISAQGFVSSTFFINYFTSTFSDINLGAGVFCEFYSRKKPNRISFYNELLYKKLDSNLGHLGNGGGAEVDLDCEKVKLINALRVSYPNKAGGRFYWGLGLDNGVRMNTLIGGKSSSVREGDFSSGFELGLIGMLGETFVLFKSFKVNTEIRYEYEFDPSKSLSFQNIGLSLQFNLK